MVGSPILEVLPPSTDSLSKPVSEPWFDIVELGPNVCYVVGLKVRCVGGACFDVSSMGSWVPDGHGEAHKAVHHIGHAVDDLVKFCCRKSIVVIRIGARSPGFFRIFWLLIPGSLIPSGDGRGVFEQLDEILQQADYLRSDFRGIAKSMIQRSRASRMSPDVPGPDLESGLLVHHANEDSRVKGTGLVAIWRIFQGSKEREAPGREIRNSLFHSSRRMKGGLLMRC